MKLEHLKIEGKVWAADCNQQSNPLQTPTVLTPASIVSQGFFHEFYYNRTATLPGWPISAVLPLIKELPAFSKIRANSQYIIFLGKETWPTAFYLRDLYETDLPLSNFLFVQPSNRKSHLHALDILVNSVNVFAVVTSLSKASFPLTQKLFLRSKQSVTQLLAFREIAEIGVKSAAFSRWLIEPKISNSDFPSWQLMLKHSKGSIKEKIWLMEGLNEKEISVYLLSELVSGSGSENFASIRCA